MTLHRYQAWRDPVNGTKMSKRPKHMNDVPKYSEIEIERRWLVDLSAVDLSSAPCREIDDLYIANSRLRLRRISAPGELTFKLGKKYGKRTALSEPITNLYLTEPEYRRLAGLPGARTRKRRYALDRGAVDVYSEPNEGLAVFEVEFEDERSAREFTPPPFAMREITNESAFSGVSLAERLATR
jgi:CYTH domain-containing protein